MSKANRYPIPAGDHRVEEEIERSRFITTVGMAASADTARAFISKISLEFADATHNCWAYVAGPPGSTREVGMSDDGEPHGTAGRPMLNTLLHSGVGDIVAVVTRYYGGRKLGKGGLVRAYSGGVVLALQDLPQSERVETVQVKAVIDYSAVSMLRRVLPNHEAELTQEDYSADVTVTITLPKEHREAFREELTSALNGEVLFEDG